MLYDVTPSSEVTGGAWYTDQELDTDFIDTLAVACYKYIYSRVRLYLSLMVRDIDGF
jgi:DNA-directed RNA polymerase III subunit RPC6